MLLFHRLSPRRLAPVAALLFADSIAACGGRADLLDGAATNPNATACPTGYVCEPTCSVPGTCSSAGAGAPVADPDAGTPTRSAEDASVSPSPVGATYPAGSVPASYATLNVLSYDVVDAKFSAALSSIVMVSDTPTNTIHVYDVTTGGDRSVTLPTPPVAVAVDATGFMAAVAYDAHVSLVDLQTGSVTTTCAVGSDAYDVALSSTGVAYVMPKTDQWVSLQVVDFATCTDTPASTVRASSRIALHPTEKALFTADQGLDPSRINRCDLTASPIDCEDAENDADWGTYAYCGALWISADGSRIYSACGVTLSVPASVTTDPCAYSGVLTGVDAIQSLAEAPSAQRVALIPGQGEYAYGADTNADTVVRVHETQYLGFVAQYELPAFPLTLTTTTSAHGKFVFTTPSMDGLYAVVQADPSSGVAHDFAVVTMEP